MPLRHRDADVGRLVLADKDGGFGAGDADILRPVAAQVSAVVALARAEAAAERIRTDLDALVRTAPVGVVVFDAGTGAVLWINQEAKRIVEGLRTPTGAPRRNRSCLQLVWAVPDPDELHERRVLRFRSSRPHRMLLLPRCRARTWSFSLPRRKGNVALHMLRQGHRSSPATGQGWATSRSIWTSTRA